MSMVIVVFDFEIFIIEPVPMAC